MSNVKAKHEETNCPRCGRAFQCKAADISNCQCYGFKLSEAAAQFITEKYGDCLCIFCLQELNQAPILFIEKFGPAK